MARRCNAPAAPAWALTGLAAAVLAGGLLGGCASRNLFEDRDSTAGRLRYFDNESATATHAQRQQGGTTGMGMPTGPSAQ